MRILFILLLILSSCIREIQKEVSPSKELDSQACPINGLAGIMINDEKSTEAVGSNIIWNEIMKNDPHKGQFLNAIKNTKLTFSFHPGGVKNQISEFVLEKSNDNEMNLPVLESVADVRTDNGLYLGQSFDDVKNILINEKGLHFDKSKISLKIENANPSMSKCLKIRNMPIYYLNIHFDDFDKIELINFGYEIP